MARPFALPDIFIVLDTETSGMRPGDGHSIIELAAQKIQGRQVIEEFETLINPGHALDPEAAKVHGLSEFELIAKGKAPADVFPSFREFIGSHPLVAHNVGFDLAFLQEHYRRLGQALLVNPLIDTIAVAREFLIVPSYSLASVARYLKVAQPQAHRAMADVATLREVLFRLADRSAGRLAV